MEPEKDTEPKGDTEEDKKPAEEASNDAPVSSSNDAPADALSRTPEELAEEAAEKEAANPTPKVEGPEDIKLPLFKRVFRKVNPYLLAFILIVVVAGVIAIVTYLNSQKPPVTPDVASQQLSEDALKQLANSDATVGNNSQTLTIQGNAIITGQTLARGNLNVAGNIQTGGSIQTPNLTVSGTSNLGTAQINTLQVASTVAIQGTTTIRDLNVSGTTSFSGAVTASQITVTRLILSGNAVLQVPNHISFTGPSPTRTINNAVAGNGGTLSINGSDTAGTINISTGSGTVPGCFAKITFQQSFPTQPRVIVSPIDISAGQIQYYVERNTTSFSICTATAAPTNQTFGFDYFVTN